MHRPLTTRAPAKINLSLHIRGRRADGYHELESLVAFAGVGDTLSLLPGDSLSLSVHGPTGPMAGPPDDNLVVKAAKELGRRVPGLRAGEFRLTKRLPVAAGIGGGSADAAGALRLLGRLNGLRLTDPVVFEAARATGADVPVCLQSRARLMRGVGDVLGPPLRLPRLFAVLVNPGVALETARVFARLGMKPGEVRDAAPHPSIPSGGAGGELLGCLGATRNDLERAAIAIAPVVGEALCLLHEEPACRLARMSGSGATVLGLFDDCVQSAGAARRMRAARPGWWVKATSLR